MKTLRKSVYAFHAKQILDKVDSFTEKHFPEESRSTLYQILRQKEDEISNEIQNVSGRPAKGMTKSGIKQLFKLFDQKLLHRLL